MFQLFNLKVKKREFGYQPRYYDADKEEFDRRVNARKNENKSGELSKMRIKKEFGYMRHGSNTSFTGTSFLRSASFYRLIIIIVVLLLVSSFVLNTWLPKFMDMLFPLEQQQYELLDKYEDYQ